MRRWSTAAIAASLALTGCGADPTHDAEVASPPARVASAPAPSAAIATRAAASVAPSAAPPEAPPAWLDPAYDESTAPLRARLVRTPELFADERNLALNAPPPNANRILVVPVFAEPRRRDSTHVRILCSSTRERVALFVKRADLALVTRRGAVLAPHADRLEAALTDASAPRMVFDAGVEIEAPRAVTSGSVAVSYVRARVSVRGFMQRAQLDEVYEWPLAGATFVANGSIPHDAVFLDAPRGKTFGWIVELPDKGAYEVETVGAPDGDHVLVRARVEGGVLTGWVDRTNLKVGLVAGGIGGMRGSHVARSPTITRVPLPKGTQLSLGDEVIGVIKADGYYTCTSSCSAARPLVRVPACGDTVDLVAQLPAEAG